MVLRLFELISISFDDLFFSNSFSKADVMHYVLKNLVQRSFRRWFLGYIFSRVHATLQPALSVCRSVGHSFGDA